MKGIRVYGFNKTTCFEAFKDICNNIDLGYTYRNVFLFK